MNHSTIQLWAASEPDFKIRQPDIIKLLLRHFRFFLFCLLASCFCFQTSAFAACSSGGNEGDIMYNKDNHVLQFCDGTNWVPMGKSWTGADGGGCTGGSAG